MISSREDFLMTLIGCGQLDLRLIDDVEYDWCDVLERVDFNCLGEKKMPAIMHAVFDVGKDEMNEAIVKRVDYLEDTKKTYGISEEQENELEDLKKLNPYNDLEVYHNYLDTHVTCVNHKSVYKKLMSKELENFAAGTGFVVEFDKERRKDDLCVMINCKE